jgi:hypothetical protein
MWHNTRQEEEKEGEVGSSKEDVTKQEDWNEVNMGRQTLAKVLVNR